MKKLTIATLLASACAFALIGAGCGGENSSSSSSSSSGLETTVHSVTFTQTNGVTYITESGDTANTNDVVSFSLKISSFYAGTPAVLLNGQPLTANEDGVYSFTVTENAVITVTGIQLAEADLAGSGASDDAYAIDSPADLLYIAEQVNAGNAAYRNACYQLMNDLDFEGEELYVIGDGRSDEAYFAGVFNGSGHTISNFQLNANGALHVGLFGWIVADVNTQNTGAIYSLNLDNFEINATAARDDIMSCGSLVGYSIGYTITQCDATNGTINVHADVGYPAYVGGLVGFVQSVYLDEMSNSYNSSVAYCVSDVDVYGNYGQVLAAGGVVGYTMTNSDQAVAYIVNCYSTGEVLGAIRAGGVVGNLGQYTSVLACYSTGNVSALSTLADSSSYPEFCSAFAGGVVGYAENDTVIADCFAAGKTSAYAALGNDYLHVGDTIAGGDIAGYITANSCAYVEYNCYGANSGVALTSVDFQKNTLKYPDYDWVFAEGEYPTINYEYSDTTVFSLSLDFGEYAEDVEDMAGVDFDTHYPLIYLHMSQDLPEYITVNEEKHIYSYGYYFDEACTVKAPYSFIVTRNITLYVGCADYTEIAGTYTIHSKNAGDIALELKPDGSYIYEDGSIKTSAYYVYDGKKITFFDARFARYQAYDFYAGDGLTEEEITLIADQLNFRDFHANVLQDKKLAIYDGVYFTENAPLVATPVAGSSPTQTNMFIGTWESTQTIAHSYTFKADGTFTYDGAEFVNGTYTTSEDGKSLTLSTGETVALVDGFAVVGNTTYYKENSYHGSWVGFSYSAMLYLDGIAGDGVGHGTLALDGGSKYSLVYLAETDNALRNYITLYSENQFVGCLTLASNGNTLTGRLYNQQSGAMDQVTFYLKDTFSGEWISSDSTFGIMDFNGFGNYTVQWGNLAERGTITINGEDVEYALIDNFNGSFSYNGVAYRLKFNEVDGTVTVTSLDNSTTVSMQRKDAFADVTFLDSDGTQYTFDGRGELGAYSGILTVTKTDGAKQTYAYQVNGDALLLSAGGVAGNIAIVGDNYTFSFGDDEQVLYTKTFFTGEWALNSMNKLFVISGVDVNNKATAVYPLNGKDTKVNCVYVNDDLLTFTYEQYGETITMYVYALAAGGIMICDNENPYLGSYQYAAMKDEVYGKWQGLTHTFTFDGSSNTSAVNATAVHAFGSQKIEFYYMKRSNGTLLLWSKQATSDGSTTYYVIEWCETTEPTAYKQGDKAFKLIKVDALYMLEAKDDKGIVYTFDGQGTVTTSNGVSYTYVVNAFNNANYTVALTLTKDDVEYKATIDYSGTEVMIIFH